MTAVDRDRIRRDAGRAALEATRRDGPDAARRKLLRTIETELKAVPASDRGPVACRAGCAFCCHMRVLTTPVEVFGLLDWIEAHFDETARDGFRQRVASAAHRVHGLDPTGRLTTTIACPVLVDGNCSAYAARPYNCRSYHSLDRDACEHAFEDPTDETRTHPQFTAVARVHEGVQGGLMAGVAAAGYDAGQYELITALAEALDDPGARTRFESGKKAFERAVPLDQVG